MLLVIMVVTVSLSLFQTFVVIAKYTCTWISKDFMVIIIEAMLILYMLMCSD